MVSAIEGHNVYYSSSRLWVCLQFCYVYNGRIITIHNEFYPQEVTYGFSIDNPPYQDMNLSQPFVLDEYNSITFYSTTVIYLEYRP